MSGVLREVEGGHTLRVTVRGRAVADLIPVSDRQDHLTPEAVRRIVDEAPLDEDFASDVATIADATVDEL